MKASLEYDTKEEQDELRQRWVGALSRVFDVRAGTDMRSEGNSCLCDDEVENKRG